MHEGNAHLSCRKEREGLSTFSAFIIISMMIIIVLYTRAVSELTVEQLKTVNIELGQEKVKREELERKNTEVVVTCTCSYRNHFILFYSAQIDISELEETEYCSNVFRHE